MDFYFIIFFCSLIVARFMNVFKVLFCFFIVTLSD